LASRLNERIHDLKTETTRWVDDLVRRTFERFNTFENKTKDTFAEIERKQNEESELFKSSLERIKVNLQKDRRELIERTDALSKDVFKAKKDMKIGFDEMSKEIRWHIENLKLGSMVLLGPDDGDLLRHD